MPGVDLWRVDLERVVDTSVLSPDELQRARRFVFERDAARYRHCRAALRHLLSVRCAMRASELQFDVGEHGKPYLAHGRTEFNVSHTGAVGLICISNGPAVGVDVEILHHIDDLDSLVRRICTASEAGALSALCGAERDLAFLRCWTRKEAGLKAVGCGLSVEPTDVEAGIDAAPSETVVQTATRRWRVRVGCLDVGPQAVAALAQVIG